MGSSYRPAGFAAFACLIGRNFAVRRPAGLTTGLLLALIIAASIFLDARTVFLFFRRIFSRSN